MKKDYAFYINGKHSHYDYVSLYNSIKDEFEFIIKDNKVTVRLTDEEVTIFTLKYRDKFCLEL